MDRRGAKELVHIDGWLTRVVETVARGEQSYLADARRQGAGNSMTTEA